MPKLNSNNLLLKTTNLNVKISILKTIINNVNLEIKENDIIILKGQNGSGKTTLVEYLSNQIKSNKIWRKNHLTFGYVPQSIVFEETVEVLLKKYSKMLKVKFNENTFKGFSLEKIKHIPFEKISSGERQRVMLAISLLRKPDILILDEFIRGLDQIAQDSFYKFIKKLQKEYHFAILYISHESDDIAKINNVSWTIKDKKLEVKYEN